jgi:hypothetical protein
VARTVARVILQTTGRCVEPQPGEPLFGRHLHEVELVPLLLALQDEFGVVFAEHEATLQRLGSIESIAALLDRKRRGRASAG